MWINALRLTCFINSILNLVVTYYVEITWTSRVAVCTSQKPKVLLCILVTPPKLSHGGTTWPVQGLTWESCCPPYLCFSLGRFYNLHSVPCSTATLLKIPKFGHIELTWSHRSGAAKHNRAMDSSRVSWLTGPEKCVSIWIWHCFASRDNSNKLVGVI